MQTNLADIFRGTPDGEEAESILRKCVHCGFCTATCPTYQLLGDELDGPRGRIYLIKEVLEGKAPTAKTQLHLDRCLTCRSCETTCPSGVQYGRLVDIGRKLVDERVERPAADRLKRKALANVVPSTGVFGALMKMGQLARPLLPSMLQEKVPASAPTLKRWPTRFAAGEKTQTMIALAGCVQPAMSPEINIAAANVLGRLGVQLVEPRGAGCCGAVRYHLNEQTDGLDDMRRLIDAWWPHIQAGASAIVMTASGCGAMVREYGHLLRNDPKYAAKAERVSAMTKDIAEVIADLREPLAAALMRGVKSTKVAFHPPCTLQHGQKIRGVTESILRDAGFELTPIADSHLCCGSAGTYSILQPELAGQLRTNKLAALQAGGPEAILSSNIGCLSHLAAGTPLPVKHWIVALQDRLAPPVGT